ncbi:DUF5954 family protein [Streptomyces griseocarneus]|nr:DUF5954 family protein [Streptomyces griseocarneus]
MGNESGLDAADLSQVSGGFGGGGRGGRRTRRRAGCEHGADAEGAVRGSRTGRRQGTTWRVVVAVKAGCPQQAQGNLNSLMWFRAKDEAQNTAERRSVLAAVARLESERVDELTALGIRYRVVRAEEYAGLGQDGIEQPRPDPPRARRPQLGPGEAGGADR